MTLRNATVSQLLRIAISLFFLFSGCIKLNDPVGFSLTLEAYLRGFALDLNTVFLHFVPYSLPIALSVCIIEVLLGMALLLQFKTRFILRALLVLTGFFTLLTLYTLWFRRVDSCGCLSDALPLTPRQSFTKNLLLLLTLHILHQQPPSYTKTRLPFAAQVMLLLGAGISSMWVGLYTFHTLPLLEVGPYKIDTHIPDLLHLTRSLYDKKEENKETYKEPENLLDITLQPIQTNRATQSRATSFAIWNEEREITPEVLQGTHLIGILQNPAQLDAEAKLQLAAFAEHLAHPIKFLWLLPFHIDRAALPASFTQPIAWGNANLLHTLLRANIGFVLLQEGTVQGKWSYQDLPKVRKYLIRQGWYQAKGKPCTNCHKHIPRSGK